MGASVVAGKDGRREVGVGEELLGGAARRPAIGGSHRDHDHPRSVEADNLNLRATLRRQAQQIVDLEARLSELLGEQAYNRTGQGAPHNRTVLEEQTRVLENEVQELRATFQDRDEELGAVREAHRQLMGQLNKKGQ